MIRVDNISLQLNKRQILSHISLELSSGKIYGLVGNNGCGKTMLMKCICGFVHPTEGKIEADGKQIGKDKIQETMELVGLDPNLKLPVRKYSLGMRQRLGLAQAIMEAPSALILDEPMNGLDRKGVEEIRRLLLSLKVLDRLILIASHNAEDIQVLCDRVYSMESGRIVGEEL